MLLLLLSSLAPAVQLSLTAEQMCGLSSHVVVGEVTSTETRWAEGPDGGLETVVWLSVSDVIVGDTVDTVEIVLPGGTRDGLTHWVEDVPELTLDQSYALFVSDHQLVGGERGAIALKPDANRDALHADLSRAMGACLAP